MSNASNGIGPVQPYSLGTNGQDKSNHSLSDDKKLPLFPAVAAENTRLSTGNNVPLDKKYP